MYPQVRLRRWRRTEALRQLIRETEVKVSDLIAPLFIHHEDQHYKEIDSMPGQQQIGLHHLESKILTLQDAGIPGTILFGIPSQKDAKASDAYHPEGVIARAVQQIKKIAPHFLVFADCCFCEYTDHGHCGILTDPTPNSPSSPPQNLEFKEDETLKLLGKTAVCQAQAGADVIAPSGMMDGMIAAIRQALDEAGFHHIPVLSYAVKYASALYGPFRDAAEGKPQFGDRRSYQMDPANSAEAIREASMDIKEGADMLMVKPAMMYLDIIHKIKLHFPEIPLAAYQVSGEYSLIKAGAEKGWLDHDQTMLESLLAIKRAGADLIISYFAYEFAQKFKSCSSR